uniref:Uncharacterized protein n=1 Tax=Arundo donax TaxID=35708 RepID=A0A0A8Y006_ARUDO
MPPPSYFFPSPVTRRRT